MFPEWLVNLTLRDLRFHLRPWKIASFRPRKHKDHIANYQQLTLTWAFFEVVWVKMFLMEDVKNVASLQGHKLSKDPKLSWSEAIAKAKRLAKKDDE